MLFDRKKTGARLKQLREAQEWTQEYVAMKMNVCIDHYCRIELGKRTPSLDLLCELAGLYEASLDYIVFGLEKQRKCKEVALTKSEFDEVISRLEEMKMKL